MNPIRDPVMEEMQRIKNEADAMKAMNPLPPADRALEDAMQMSRMTEEAMRATSLPVELLGISALREEEPIRIDPDLLIKPETRVLLDINAKLDEIDDSMKEPRINNFGILADKIIINNYTTINFLTALEEAIESEDIPESRKKNIIQKIKDLKNDPFVSGAGAGLFTEVIMKLIGG